MKPNDLLTKLKETASPKGCQTLDIIYQVCLEQERRGLNDFSIATIARLGYKRGVPKAQSLRNKTGEKYRALTRAFEEQHKDVKPKTQRRADDDWIEEIQNPKHKLLARMQASELVAANRKLRDFVPPGTRIEVRDHQNDVGDEDRAFNDLERRALEYVLSKEFLSKWSFSISKYGEIVDTNGAVVLKAATVDAINKALTYL